MTKVAPAFVPTLSEAPPDIVFSLVTSPNFTDKFNDVFREVQKMYYIIEEKVIDHNLIRFTIPKDHPEANETNLALYFSFVVARDYPDDPFVNAWIDKAKIFKLTEKYIADLTLKQSHRIVDRLIKILVDEYFGFFDYLRLNRNQGHYSHRCPHCHDPKNLLEGMRRLEETIINPNLARYKKEPLGKLFYGKEIAALTVLLEKIHRSYDEVSAQVEELTAVRNLIITFRDAESIAGFEPKKIESLLEKQYELYHKIASVFNPIETEVSDFCKEYRISTTQL